MAYVSLIKRFEKLGTKYELYTVFQDFVEFMAISLSKSNDKAHLNSLYKKYVLLTQKYNNNEIEIFHGIYTKIIRAMKRDISDHLGKLHRDLGLASIKVAKHYTPIQLRLGMSSLALNKSIIEKELEEKGYIILNVPCSGTGSLIISYINSLITIGFKPEKVLRVVAQEVDRTAALMCFVQLTLINIPAHIIIRDSNKLETLEIWSTPQMIEIQNKYSEFAPPIQQEVG